jgi:hypothetical protein
MGTQPARRFGTAREILVMGIPFFSSPKAWTGPLPALPVDAPQGGHAVGTG